MRKGTEGLRPECIWSSSPEGKGSFPYPIRLRSPSRGAFTPPLRALSYAPQSIFEGIGTSPQRERSGAERAHSRERSSRSCELGELPTLHARRRSRSESSRAERARPWRWVGWRDGNRAERGTGGIGAERKRSANERAGGFGGKVGVSKTTPERESRQPKESSTTNFRKFWFQTFRGVN